MTNDGSKLRDAMGRHLDGLQPGTPIEHIRQRAHRGRLLMATSLVALVALVGASGAFMLDRVADDESDRVVGPGRESSAGQIAFSRFGQDGGIMTMDADGSRVERLIAGDGHALNNPSWSPDGSKIAFHGFFGEARTEAGGLFVMDADGSNVELIEEAGNAPTWSPDGERIAFYSGEDGSLRVKDLGQTTSETIVEQEGYRIDTPDWSPDGRRVVFGGVELDILYLEDGSREVFLRVRGGSGQLLLDPAWSPDGSRIAYTEFTDTADRSTDLATVKIIEVETFRNWALGEGADPTWSPDGERIAFARTDGDVSHIYSSRIDGTDLQQLTSGPDSDHSPDWVASPAEWTPITTIDELQRELVVYDPSYRAFAVWNEGAPLVLSALVPHMESERALFCSTSQQFGGPHGEKFDARGYYYGGPAQRGLDRYESRVQDGVVLFDPQELIRGPARGEGPALEPAGRFCTEDHTEREPGFAATANGNPTLESDFRFQPYPGNTWYGPDGPIAPESGIINLIQGPEHCAWDSAALLHVGWPIGHDAADASQSRQFVRDPQRVLPQDPLMSEFDENAILFGGAEYTGYRTDFMELWLFPPDDTGAFLMFADHVEWWPRAEEPIACA